MCQIKIKIQILVPAETLWRHSKIMFSQNFQFLTCFPHIHPCSFYMEDPYKFLNEKLRSEKGKKELHFCKLSIIDDNVFYADIDDNNNKNIYMLIYTTSLKKCLRLINKALSNWKATYQKELYLLFEYQAIFQSAHRDRFDSSPPLFVFIRFLRTPSPLHSKPFIKKGLLEEMERVNDNASAFMHLNIRT